MKKIKLLITGGAGFIGSNLVDYFIKQDYVTLVRVIDDFSNGYYENIEKHLSNKKFEFIEGDIRNYETCILATKNIDKISHQAALGSVPRSIENPMVSAEVNIIGTVNIMHAAYVNKVERVILAFSSSTYGDSKLLPKVEKIIGNPLSPYAVTKSSVEQFADVFGKIYNLNWIGLRYFNVFGPNQNPTNPYAAVIPIFCKGFLENTEITVNGDGKTSRDFTYISNVILMNKLSLFTQSKKALNQVYNTACNDRISLNEIITTLNNITKKKIKVNYGPERDGDVRHSYANIDKARQLLNYEPKVKFQEGLSRTYEWYKSKYKK